MRQQRIVDYPFIGHARGGQTIHLRQTNLNGVKSEDIGRQFVESRLLPGVHIQARWLFQPCVHVYVRVLGISFVHIGLQPGPLP